MMSEQSFEDFLTKVFSVLKNVKVKKMTFINAYGMNYSLKFYVKCSHYIFRSITCFCVIRM